MSVFTTTSPLEAGAETTAASPEVTLSDIGSGHLTQLGEWGVQALTIDIDAMPDNDKKTIGWRDDKLTEIVAKIDQAVETTERWLNDYLSASQDIQCVLFPNKPKIMDHPIPQATYEEIMAHSLFLRQWNPRAGEKVKAYLSELGSDQRAQLRASLESHRKSASQLQWLRSVGTQSRKDFIEREMAILSNPDYGVRANEAKESVEYRADRALAGKVGSTENAISRSSSSMAEQDQDIIRTFRKYCKLGFERATENETMLSYDMLGRDARMGWQLIDLIGVASTGTDEEEDLVWHTDHMDWASLCYIGKLIRSFYPFLTEKYDPEIARNHSQRRAKVASAILRTVNRCVQSEDDPLGGLSPEDSQTLVVRIAKGLEGAAITFLDGTQMLSAPAFVERSAQSVISHFDPDDWSQLSLDD